MELQIFFFSFYLLRLIFFCLGHHRRLFFLCSFLTAQELAVVGKHQRGGWQGDNHAYESEQAPPDGERQQDDGGVEPYGLVHDAGDEDGFLDDLHHQHDDACCDKYPPEVLAGIGCLHQSQEDHRDNGGNLQIGHDIEHTHKKAEANGHGEVDDEETDAEKDAYTKRDERLAAEVVAHTLLHIVAECHYALTILLGNEAYPSTPKRLVVVEDEEDVHQHHKSGYHDAYHVERLGYHIPYLGQGALDELAYTVGREVSLDLTHVDMLANKLIDYSGDGAVVSSRGEIVGDKLLEHDKLLNDGRHYSKADAYDKGHEEQQHREDGEGAALKSELVLKELHYRVYQIAKQPCDEEGQQGSTQTAYEKISYHTSSYGDKTSDEAVKSDFFVHRVEG